MAVVIDGTNTPTAGGVGYGDGTELAFTSAGTSGQVLVSNGASAPAFGSVGVAGGGTGATSLTANNVILGNGTSAVQFVAPSTSGNVLTSNGTTWTSAAAPAGNLVLLSTTNVTNGSTSTTVTSGFSSTYDDYVLYLEDCVHAGSYGFAFRLLLNGSEITSNYYYIYTNGTTLSAQNGGSDIRVSSAKTTMSGNISLFNCNSSSGYKSFTCLAGLNTIGLCGGSINTAGTVTGIKMFEANGATFSSGTIRLYGIKKT